jgi:hypothetical protein
LTDEPEPKDDLTGFHKAVKTMLALPLVRSGVGQKGDASDAKNEANRAAVFTQIVPARLEAVLPVSDSGSFASLLARRDELESKNAGGAVTDAESRTAGRRRRG